VDEAEGRGESAGETAAEDSDDSAAVKVRRSAGLATGLVAEVAAMVITSLEFL
jgi:hypothetical protein